MKNLFILGFLFLFQFSIVLAQGGRLTIISEDNQKFFLVLNGIRQTDVSQDMITLKDLKETFYSVKIIFDNPDILPINEEIIIKTSGGYIHANYKLSKNGINKYKLDLISTERIVSDKENFKNNSENQTKDKQPEVSSTTLTASNDVNNQTDNIINEGAILTISAKEDEKFWVIKDGQKINAEPSYNVVISDIKTSKLLVKIIFEKENLKSIDKEIELIKKINKSELYKGKWINASINAFMSKHYTVEKKIKSKFLSSKSEEYFDLELINSELIQPEQVQEYLNYEINQKKFDIDQKNQKNIEQLKKFTVKSNINSHIPVKVVSKSDIKGPKDVKIFICNNTGYMLDKVIVNVEYKAFISKQIKCLFNVTFNNVPPDGQWYEQIPPLCSEGLLIEAKINKVISKELDLK